MKSDQNSRRKFLASLTSTTAGGMLINSFFPTALEAREIEPNPEQIGDVKMMTYIDWMRSSYYISVVGNPAISVPSAFSKGGLPIGIQIVGRHHADFSVLQIGYAFEQATNVGKRRPGIVG